MSDFSLPAGVAAAEALPEILPPAVARGRILGFVLRHPGIAIGGALLVVMTFIAIAAPWLGTVDPQALDPADMLIAPSPPHWFGTDMLGRDLYSRVFYGARISLVVGFAVAALATAGGMLIGLVSGFARPLDAVLMRIMDGVLAVPAILLAIALMALTQGSVGNVIIAITISQIPQMARLVRGMVLSLREQPFVEAAIASGTRTPRLVWRHIVPNTLAPVIVQATYICAVAMIIEAILDFIGAGTPPVVPSWGNIMAQGRALWEVKPFIVFFPAVFLSVTVLAVNLLGDGLRDWLDPRLGERH